MILRRSLTACSGADLGPFLESSFEMKINLNLANALVYGRFIAKNKNRHFRTENGI